MSACGDLLGSSHVEACSCKHVRVPVNNIALTLVLATKGYKGKRSSVKKCYC